VDPEAGHGDLRLVAVLFEEHPLQRLGAAEAIGRQERRALGEIEQHGIRLREAPAILEDDGRYAPIRIDRQELRRAGLALEDVLFDQTKRNSQLRQQQAHLVAIAGRKIVVEREHRAPILLPNGTVSGAMPMSIEET
jgi:hypothetical protein